MYPWGEIFLEMLTVTFIKNRDDLENLNQLVSLQNRVKALKLQDKLEKQNSHEDMGENWTCN